MVPWEQHPHRARGSAGADSCSPGRPCTWHLWAKEKCTSPLASSVYLTFLPPDLGGPKESLKQWVFLKMQFEDQRVPRVCEYCMFSGPIPALLSRERWGGAPESKFPYALLIAKFRLKLKKVGKTTRSFGYNLNKIPYNYTVEVTSRFKGLDLIEYMKNCGRRFMTLYRRQGSRQSLRKEMRESKMAVWGGLTNSCEKKRSQKRRRKGNKYPF